MNNIKQTTMYIYEQQKSFVFTEKGQRTFLKVRDNVNNMLAQAGAVDMMHAIKGCTGDSWEIMACVDRLVELGEITEITGRNVAGQYRVFVKTC